MRHVKKIAAILLAALLVFSAVATVAAATQTDTGTSTTKGKITITDGVEGYTYKVYKMFDLESYNNTESAYSYVITNDWEDFVKTGDGKDYFQLDSAEKYVTVKNGVTIADNSTVAETLAKAALAYAESKNLTATYTLNKANNFTVDDVDLGYYVVDSSMGTLCSLGTTNNFVDITEKNDKPTITKQVKASNSDTWSADGGNSTAKIGDIVDYKITITAKKGAANYELHDKLSNGLTLLNNETVGGKTYNITVKAGKASENESTYTEVGASNCTIKTATSSPAILDTHTFDIVFTEGYLNSLTEDTKIVVEYSAQLNRDAVVTDDNNTFDTTNSNTNTAELKYDDEGTSTTGEKTTFTNTYYADIVKTDSDKNLLDGAEFLLYADEDGNTAIPVVKLRDNNYRVAVEGETGVNIVVKGGGITKINGLNTGGVSYYLKEVKTPQGYNTLEDLVAITMPGAGHSKATVTGTTYTSGGTQIVNNKGSLLPITGGIGTAIFYVTGGAVVLGAFVLLVIKRRRKSY